jgi:hypothetical protein
MSAGNGPGVDYLTIGAQEKESHLFNRERFA